jgi:hypothetical protein
LPTLRFLEAMCQRFRLDLTPYPTITRIFARCMGLEAFSAAHPDRQPDREA